MSGVNLHRWAFEATTSHPFSFTPYDHPEQKAVDQIFTNDGKRIWCNFSGEQPQSKLYPELREHPFLVVGHVNVEDDSTTTFNSLTSCGNVIREVHSSKRTNDIAGPIIESARLLNSDEVEALLVTIKPLLIS